MSQYAMSEALASGSAPPTTDTARPLRELIAPYTPGEGAGDQIRVVLGAVPDQMTEAVLPRL